MEGRVDQSNFRVYKKVGGAFRCQSSLLARSDPNNKTMKKMKMMILFKTIKVMSGAQNKVRIITSFRKISILPSQLEKSRKIIM